ncbi:MAG: DUF4192 family protein [Kineosporiaceae bacterium]|nr:DUF4192 family protein [Kineosporiaceae bacterium]
MTTPTWPPAPDAAFETVQLRSEADLLTAVPFLLGFHPDPGSIVVIALHQTGIAVTIRMDLPRPGPTPTTAGPNCSAPCSKSRPKPWPSSAT